MLFWELGGFWVVGVVEEIALSFSCCVISDCSKHNQ